MYFASAQKCVTELNSVTNNPMLCAKLTAFPAFPLILTTGLIMTNIYGMPVPVSRCRNDLSRVRRGISETMQGRTQGEGDGGGVRTPLLGSQQHPCPPPQPRSKTPTSKYWKRMPPVAFWQL